MTLDEFARQIETLRAVHGGEEKVTIFIPSEERDYELGFASIYRSRDKGHFRIRPIGTSPYEIRVGRETKSLKDLL